MKTKRTKSNENPGSERLQALRAWFRFMAESDFSEQECRAALAELSDTLPSDWLECAHNHIYGKDFSESEWRKCQQQLKRQRAGGK